jgi:predicted transcriptional regulator
MYPVTHSIGFIQVLEYLSKISKIHQNSLNLSDSDIRNGEIKVAMQFLRDFKTSTHQYIKKQDTWFRSDKRTPQYYKILKKSSENSEYISKITDLINMDDTDFSDQILNTLKLLEIPTQKRRKPKGDDFEQFLSQQLKSTPTRKQYEPESKILNSKFRLENFLVSF